MPSIGGPRRSSGLFRLRRVVGLVTVAEKAAVARESGVPLVVTDADADDIDLVFCPPGRGSGRGSRGLCDLHLGLHRAPQGVLVPHSAITNFVDVVIQIYDVRPSDRIYQGLTIAFDFSLEELWPTWGVGGDHDCRPVDGRQVGSGLADLPGGKQGHVLSRRPPTVLATVDRDLPLIRTTLGR